jgi:hypothetical protein
LCVNTACAVPSYYRSLPTLLYDKAINNSTTKQNDE